MHAPILVSSLALLLLTACASTDAPEPEPKTHRVGDVVFHVDTAIVAIPVRDLEASKAWYRRVLGSEVVYEVPEQRWCEVSTPASGTLLGLHEQSGTAGPANALGVGVADMAKARAHLVSHGVELEHDVVVIPGIVKLLYFRDPDGNRMWFYAPVD